MMGAEKAARKPAVQHGPAARNTSALLVNPLDAAHIVGVEEITRPDGVPMISARVSFDAGTSWREAWPLPLEPEWMSLVGPVLTMDAAGTVNLAALALEADRNRASLVVYRSEDGGVHWNAPAAVLQGNAECCYAIAADLNADSPYRGSIYVAADMGEMLCFARSTDGRNWSGLGRSGAGPWSSGMCFNPEILVDGSGKLHLIWMTGPTGCNILAAESADGGNTFSAPVTVAESVVGVQQGLPETAPAACVAPDGVTVCVWSGDRDGRARIYRRRSLDGGRTWEGPAEGEPLRMEESGQHEFQPHLLVTAGGEICCAYYEYGPKEPGGDLLVDLAMVVSYDHGATFISHMVLSSQPWDPAVDRPLSRAATEGALRGLASW